MDVLKTKIAGKWNEMTGAMKEKFNDLTGDELAETEGNAQKIAGKLQAKYPEQYATVEDAMEDAKSLGEELMRD